MLRRSLQLDAAASGALGILAAAATPVLRGLLGVPASVLVPIGLALIAWAVAVWIIGSRAEVNRQAVRAVIALNLAWVAASLLVVAAGALPLTGLGVAFVLLQAAAVALFAELQVVGLRRAMPRGA